jgi:citrate lyase subunit beta/citryl-CoA lyase
MPTHSASTSRIAQARSFLFVPATTPERYVKALNSGADMVIIDLEDAVSPTDKPAARMALEAAFDSLTTDQKAQLMVRINPSDTDHWKIDTDLVVQLSQQGLGGVVLPKAQTVTDLQALDARLAPACGVLPLIESLAGLDAIDTIASAPRVERLAFGHLDFQLDLGIEVGPDEAALIPVRMAITMATRRAHLAPPVDGVTVNTQDEATLQSDIVRAQQMGFGGKLCIHPKQVGTVNSAWLPSAEALAWATRVVEAAEATTAGAFQLDGRMIDAPVISKARQILSRRRD